MAVAGQNTRRRPARQENYYKSKQTYFSYHLDKAFHLPEFQAKPIFHAKLLSGRFLLKLTEVPQNIHATPTEGIGFS